jgi:hypothetical protein
MIRQEEFTSDKDDMATTVMPNNSTTANDLGNGKKANETMISQEP